MKASHSKNARQITENAGQIAANHKQAGQQKCKFCDKEFQTFTEYFNHQTTCQLQNQTNENDIFEPVEAPKEKKIDQTSQESDFFKSKTTIQINQSQIKSIKCFNCLTSFEDINLWKTHKSTCEKNGKMESTSQNVQPPQNGFSCSICGENYNDRLEIISHMKIHPIESLTNKLLASTSNLSKDSQETDNHTKGRKRKLDLPSSNSTFNELEKFICAFCDTQYENKEDLIQHFKTHTKPPKAIPISKTKQ